MALSWRELDVHPVSNRTDFRDVAHDCEHEGTTIAVDLSDSPKFVRLTLSGDWPGPEQQRAVRESLRASGELTADTRMLIDLRELAPLTAGSPMASPKEGVITKVQAYLVATSEQHHFARQCRIAAGAGRVVEIFIEERAAVEWLWNADADF